MYLFQVTRVRAFSVCTLCSTAVVLTLTHRHNAVRSHRTGSNNFGVEDYLRTKIILLFATQVLCIINFHALLLSPELSAVSHV